MTEKEEMLLNLWFNNIEGIGQEYRKRLLKKYGSIENVYNAPADSLASVLEKNKLINSFEKSRDMKVVHELYKRLADRNIWFTYPTHSSYPKKLLHIYDAPDILYVRGKLDERINQNNRAVGIVGARSVDTYGREIARMFSRELAARGISIISGLARGVDSMAHLGALDGEGYTIAVLGCGINVTYPPENGELFTRIERNGAVISEYGLDVVPKSGLFPLRNRIISGLSDGILVVQARKKSGSLITADWALEQGKQVYSIPGRLFDAGSEGTNNLIKQGAMCVTSPGDILADLQIYRDKKEDEKNFSGEECSLMEGEDIKNILAPSEKMVYSCLGLEPVYIDDIIRISGLGITKVISILYVLEERKIIKQPVHGYYIIAV